MTLYLEDPHKFFEENKDLLEKVKQVIEQCAKNEKIPYDFEVSLTVADKEEIRKINQDYREIDSATDVLSFPQIEPEDGVIQWEGIDKNMYMNLDTNLFILGDIVLCHEVAKEQAVAYGHTLKREVCFLVSHSMFHLLGYDHMIEEEEHIMCEKQEEVLAQLEIKKEDLNN